LFCESEIFSGGIFLFGLLQSHDPNAKLTSCLVIL